MRALRPVSVVLVAVLALAGCSDSNKKKPLEGKRISVLDLEKQLQPDPALADLVVALPKPADVSEWPLVGGNAAHDMGHPSLGDPLKEAWTASVGDGASRHGILVASPVASGGTIYTMDALKLVTAFAESDGHQLWQTDVSPPDNDNHAWGGGIAFDDGKIFVATGYGEVLSLDAKDGHVIWRHGLDVPLHGAPTIADGRLFVISTQADLIAMSTDDGHELWRYSDIPEPAQFAGAPSPAVLDDALIAPFASGDIVALRTTNGLPLWTDNLAATGRFDAVSTLSDIRGLPVIDRGLVIAIDHSGHMVAIDQRSGERAWDQDIGGISQPWVAGDFVYVLSTTGQLYCLTRTEGRIKWITQLDQKVDPTDPKSDAITWTGPLLAGDRLIVVSSNGEAWAMSPYTGAPLGKIELPKSSFVAPIVVDRTLYILSDDGTLTALR